MLRRGSCGTKSQYSELLDLAAGGRRGPQRRFGPFHYFKALDLVSGLGRTGRAEVARNLDIGEGSARTLLDDLHSAGYISRNNAGIRITERGMEILRSFPVKVLYIGEYPLATGRFSCLAVVAGGRNRVSNGIEQRDTAVKHGGSGAITLVYRDRRLLIPPDLRELKDSYIAKILKQSFDICEDAAVLIGSAERPLSAEEATFYAALTLTDCRKMPGP